MTRRFGPLEDMRVSIRELIEAARARAATPAVKAPRRRPPRIRPERDWSATAELRYEPGFRKMSHYLRRQRQELAEERYVTAIFGIRTSWRAVERAGIYWRYRHRGPLTTRSQNSLRPIWPGPKYQGKAETSDQGSRDRSDEERLFRFHR